MICPLMAKDAIKEPKYYVDSCAMKFKNHCSLNIIAQSLYYQAKMSNHQEKDSQIADTQE
jgi:hypothetical protein